MGQSHGIGLRFLAIFEGVDVINSTLHTTCFYIRFYSYTYTTIVIGKYIFPKRGLGAAQEYTNTCGNLCNWKGGLGTKQRYHAYLNARYAKYHNNLLLKLPPIITCHIRHISLFLTNPERPGTLQPDMGTETSHLGNLNFFLASSIILTGRGHPKFSPVHLILG